MSSVFISCVPFLSGARVFPVSATSPGSLTSPGWTSPIAEPNASKIYKQLNQLDAITTEASALMMEEAKGKMDSNVALIVETFLVLCQLQREKLDRTLGRRTMCQLQREKLDRTLGRRTMCQLQREKLDRTMCQLQKGGSGDAPLHQGRRRAT